MEKPLLKIAVSARAVFNMEDSHAVFLEKGQAAFDAYMRKRESKPLRPGVAFPFIKKIGDLVRGTSGLIGLVLLSSNSVAAGRRVMRSAMDHGLTFDQAVFTTGGDRLRYARALEVGLFLSANGDEVRVALEHGIPAAVLIPADAAVYDHADLRVAFDGDAILFSHEAETVMQTQGLFAFRQHEIDKATIPLLPGPLKPLMTSFSELKKRGVPIRVALVTARDVDAHARALNTLDAWGLEIDEAALLAGDAKGPVLKAFGADMFFDDTLKHVLSAGLNEIAAGHVPYVALTGEASC